MGLEDELKAQTQECFQVNPSSELLIMISSVVLVEVTSSAGLLTAIRDTCRVCHKGCSY